MKVCDRMLALEPVRCCGRKAEYKRRLVGVMLYRCVEHRLPRSRKMRE